MTNYFLIPTYLLGGAVIGYFFRYFAGSNTQRQSWDKDTWDEFQETIMIASALLLYGGFELLCFFNTEYAAAQHTNQTRTALITIVSNLFTFKFTKSAPQRGYKNGG